MAASSRDRVTIDLRGIGGAVRAAADSRNSTLALFARQALVAALPSGDGPGLPASGFTSHRNLHQAAKLTLRMAHEDADALLTGAAALGLSQGQYVARLVNGTPLPIPAVDRLAELSALRFSNDQLAVIAADLALFLCMLARADQAALEPMRQRMLNLDHDIAHHLNAAATLLNRMA